MDINLTGQLWGMPINLVGQVVGIGKRRVLPLPILSLSKSVL